MTARDIVSAAAGNAGIVYVGGRTQAVTASTTNQTISLTSLSGGAASAPATGDMVIVYLGIGSTVTSTPNISGYTKLTFIRADDTYDANLTVYYKFMGATPDTNFVITSGTGSTSDAGAVAVEVWRNVDSILPFDVTTTTATGINSVLCNPPAITPVTPGAIIVAGGAGAHNQSTATFSSSDLTAFLSSGGNSTNDVTIGLGYKVWELGAFDPAAFTFSGSDSTNFSWAAATLALYPTQGFTGTVPTFVASATASSAVSATTLTVNKPSGTTTGHLMVAFISTSVSSATFTTPAGWTEVADSSGSVFNQCLAYKVAGASEGADYTFTCSASGDMSGAIATFSSAAYDITGAFSSLGTTTPFSAPSITTQTYPSVLLAFGAAEIDDTGSLSLPTDMTSVAQIFATNMPIRIVAQTVRVGATGTRSFTVSTSQIDGTRAILAAIKPA